MPIKPEKYWTFFVLALGLFALGSSVRSFLEISSYLKLQEKAPVLECVPQMTHVKRKGYQLELSYFYEIQNKTYEQRQTLTKQFFKNKEQAQITYLALKKESPFVWFDQKHPEQGKMIKKFPLKNLFSSSLLLVLCLYFWALGKYIIKKTTEG